MALWHRVICYITSCNSRERVLWEMSITQKMHTVFGWRRWLWNYVYRMVHTSLRVRSNLQEMRVCVVFILLFGLCVYPNICIPEAGEFKTNVETFVSGMNPPSPSSSCSPGEVTLLASLACLPQKPSCGAGWGRHQDKVTKPVSHLELALSSSECECGCCLGVRTTGRFKVWRVLKFDGLKAGQWIS